ncbi:MAG: hypothetical protein ABH833_00685, partial [Parcubacteria group bacterium]
MTLKSKIILLVIVLLPVGGYLYFSDFNLIGPDTTPPPIGGLVNFLEVPDNYTISVFARGLEDPRVIAFDPKGRVLVSETKAGRVTMLEDLDNDGLAETKTTVIEGLNNPHGLAFYEDSEDNNYLYIAETDKVSRYLYNADGGALTEEIREDIISFPEEFGKHFTRTIIFGPNYQTTSLLSGGGYERFTFAAEKLYISVGAPCDACIDD